MHPRVTGMKKDRGQWRESINGTKESTTVHGGRVLAREMVRHFLSRQFCWQSSRFSSRTPCTIRFILRALPCRIVVFLHFLIVFISWLHLGFFWSCGEPEIAESPGPAGSSLPHPCGWDFLSCNLWSWRLGMRTKRLQRSGQPQIILNPGYPPRAPTSPWSDFNLRVSPQTEAFFYSPLLGSDLFLGGLILSVATVGKIEADA